MKSFKAQWFPKIIIGIDVFYLYHHFIVKKKKKYREDTLLLEDLIHNLQDFFQPVHSIIHYCTKTYINIRMLKKIIFKFTIVPNTHRSRTTNFKELTSTDFRYYLGNNKSGALNHSPPKAPCTAETITTCSGLKQNMEYTIRNSISAFHLGDLLLSTYLGFNPIE